MRPLRAHAPHALRGELLERARAAAPREACGLLLGRRTPDGIELESLAELRNCARDPSAFELEPLDVLAAERAALASGCEVVGAWHSHVDAPAVPSVRDLAGGGYGFALVISLRANELRAWHGPVELELV